MANIHNTDPASMLETIQRVEAPPFLLTRIRQQIANRQDAAVPTRWAWAAGLSFVLILALNIYAITGSSRGTRPQANLVQTMDLYPHNSLYE